MNFKEYLIETDIKSILTKTGNGKLINSIFSKVLKKVNSTLTNVFVGDLKHSLENEFEYVRTDVVKKLSKSGVSKKEIESIRQKIASELKPTMDKIESKINQDGFKKELKVIKNDKYNFFRYNVDFTLDFDFRSEKQAQAFHKYREMYVDALTKIVNKLF